MNQDRRDFLRTCGCLSVVGAVALTGISCDKDDGGGGPTGPQPESCPFTINGDGNLELDLSECGLLDSENSAVAIPNTPRGTLLLTRTTGENYFALSNVCSHQQCGVNATTPTLNCPCHGSRYDLEGNVVQGPAPRALTSFPVTKAGSVLTVDLP